MKDSLTSERVRTGAILVFSAFSLGAVVWVVLKEMFIYPYTCGLAGSKYTQLSWHVYEWVDLLFGGWRAPLSACAIGFLVIAFVKFRGLGIHRGIQWSTFIITSALLGLISYAIMVPYMHWNWQMMQLGLVPDWAWIAIAAPLVIPFLYWGGAAILLSLRRPTARQA